MNASPVHTTVASTQSASTHTVCTHVNVTWDMRVMGLLAVIGMNVSLGCLTAVLTHSVKTLWDPLCANAMKVSMAMDWCAKTSTIVAWATTTAVLMLAV